jgi:hypothetical protein
LALVIGLVINLSLGIGEVALEELNVDCDDALFGFEVPELVGLVLLTVADEHALVGLGL